MQSSITPRKKHKFMFSLCQDTLNDHYIYSLLVDKVFNLNTLLPSLKAFKSFDITERVCEAAHITIHPIHSKYNQTKRKLCEIVRSAIRLQQ